jgi:hypothetical protein
MVAEALPEFRLKEHGLEHEPDPMSSSKTPPPAVEARRLHPDGAR